MREIAQRGHYCADREMQGERYGGQGTIRIADLEARIQESEDRSQEGERFFSPGLWRLNSVF